MGALKNPQQLQSIQAVLSGGMVGLQVAPLMRRLGLLQMFGGSRQELRCIGLTDAQLLQFAVNLPHALEFRFGKLDGNFGTLGRDVRNFLAKVGDELAV